MALVLDNEAERDWLRKRFYMLKVDAIEDLDLLRRLNLKMSTAQTIAEAEQSLTALNENGKLSTI